MSDDYNLDKGVNTDLTIGGDSLSFPIGKTKPILLSSMLNANSIDVLKLLTDGSYSLQIKDSTQIKVQGIDPVTFTIVPFVIQPVNSVFTGTALPYSLVKQEKTMDYSKKFISLASQPNIDKIIIHSKNESGKTAVLTNTYYFNFPSQTSDIVIHQFVSNDAKKINNISLKSPAQLVFKMNINNINPQIDSMTFYNYTIKLPSFLRFNDPEVNPNNELILNNGFSVRNGFTKILTFEMLDFNSEGGIGLTNGDFSLNKQISMQGSAFIKETTLTPAEIGTFEIQPTIVIGNMSLSQIEGDIKPVIDPVSQKITLNLPNVLKQTGNVLDIQNPVITLQVGNSMGFSVNAGLSLNPKSNGITIPSSIVSTQFDIPVATNLGQSSWSKYCMAKSTGSVTSGYQPLIVENLPNLMKIAPDEIEMNLSPAITGITQRVDLYSPKNQLDINYTVNVPLDFGKNFSIQYQDTISDLKKSLEDIIKMTKQVEIIAFIVNEIPLNLKLNINPLDISKQVIPGISISTPDSIKSCNADGSSQKSTLKLVITENTAGSLTQLDALKIHISAIRNSTIAGIPLKANQSITAELRIRIPHGFTITQN